MKWPFVRRSKYDNAKIYGINTAREITEKTSYIYKLEDQIEIYKKLHDEYAQLNHNYMVEINRLNQELASELNSHRETRETKNKVIESNLNQIRGLEGFFEREFNLHKDTKQDLEETKDALKIAQEDNKKLDVLNNKWWNATKVFVDSINESRNNFLNNK